MVREGDLLWTPSEEFARRSPMAIYMRWLRDTRGLDFSDYEALRQWSVQHLEDFWASLWDYFEILSDTPYQKVLDTRTMPGCHWFEGSRVNYAEHLLRPALSASPDKIAVLYASERQELRSLTWHDLARQVRVLATQLRALGIRPGDRIVSYMPNVPETLVAVLASTAVGAVWASSAPEFGVTTVIDRFAQIEPKLLFTCDGYVFGGQQHTRAAEVAELVERLPTLETVICVPVLETRNPVRLVPGARLWSELMSGPDVPVQDFRFERVAHDHALWVLFSSGTTGLPKAIAQSHVGIVLEHYKLVRLHMGLTPDSVMFFYSTAGWMMWNVVVSSLLAGGTVVLYDGSPTHPDMNRLWQLAQDAGVTYFGAGASYLQLMRRNEVVPKEHFQLKIEATLTGGSPVGPELFDWFYENVTPDCWFSSQSGGTETCSCLVSAVPSLPVYAGEIQARALGIDLHAWNDAGQPVIDEVGELVLTSPFPSMPIYFWNDPQGRRYRESYFDVFAGVWRHGDFIKINARGGCYIYGRSDSTLNRFGVRIGTSEVYQVIEKVPEVADSLVVCCELPDGGFFMPLFVVVKPGERLTYALRERINERLRLEASPRHAPDRIYAIDEVPYTLTGKKLEVPVRKLLMGWPLEKAASRDAMRNPASIDYFLRFAQESIDYEWRDADAPADSQSTKEKRMAIDFHCNLFTHESIQKNWYDTPEMFRLIQWWKMADRVKGKSVEEFVAMMDAAGCDKVLVPAIRMFSYKRKTMVWDITEEEVYEVVKASKGRVVGLAGFNPFQGMESVRQVEKAVKEYGFKGVYIHPYGWGIPLNHRQFYPLYAKCCELGVPVSMQVGHSAEHMPNEFGRPIHMDDIALDFPELNIIGAHTGWPWTEEMISLAWKHENVYLGIDAHNPKYLEPTLIQFMKTRGQNKVIWGTNYPAVMHGEAIKMLRTELGLTDKVAEKVLHGNAARIYNL